MQANEMASSIADVPSRIMSAGLSTKLTWCQLFVSLFCWISETMSDTEVCHVCGSAASHDKTIEIILSIEHFAVCFTLCVNFVRSTLQSSSLGRLAI